MKEKFKNKILEATKEIKDDINEIKTALRDMKEKLK